MSKIFMVTCNKIYSVSCGKIRKRGYDIAYIRGGSVNDITSEGNNVRSEFIHTFHYVLYPVGVDRLSNMQIG